MKEYTKEDDFLTKYDESQLNLRSNYKATTIHTFHPCGFVKNDFDQELILQLGKPDPMNLKCSSEIPEVQLTNSEIKDLRIEEKRNFELENCKLKSFMKDGEIQGEQADFEREIDNYSFFEKKKKRRWRIKG